MSAKALGKQLVMIDDFLIDVSLSEEHTYEADVTEYPVEKDADLTDNIRRKPKVVTMEGLVSNSPINPDIIAARNAIDESVDEALAHLEKVFDTGEPVTIRTSLKTWDSMALQSLVIPRGPNGTESLRFTARFIQVDIKTNTRNKRVAIPIAMRPRDTSKPLAAQPPDAQEPVYKVIGITRALIFNYLWYDTGIEGWREGVVADHPRKPGSVLGGAAVGGAVGGVLGASGTADVSEGWVLFKDRPFGADYNEWLDNMNDPYWKDKIAAAHDKYKDSSLGSPFDPWGDFHTNVISDIKLVHAMRR